MPLGATAFIAETALFIDDTTIDDRHAPRDA
jgi:hypothetical protein